MPPLKPTPVVLEISRRTLANKVNFGVVWRD
jgi:hypothetical protein